MSIGEFKLDSSGTRRWYNVYGNLHRDNDLPAVEYTDESKEYHCNGLLHRDRDLPAIITNGGQTIMYYYMGTMHRVGGPAYKSNSLEKWVVNGQLHREDGPAIIDYHTGESRWYYDNKLLFVTKNKSKPSVMVDVVIEDSYLNISGDGMFTYKTITPAVIIDAQIHDANLMLTGHEPVINICGAHIKNSTLSIFGQKKVKFLNCILENVDIEVSVAGNIEFLACSKGDHVRITENPEITDPAKKILMACQDIDNAIRNRILNTVENNTDEKINIQLELPLPTNSAPVEIKFDAANDSAAPPPPAPSLQPIKEKSKGEFSWGGVAAALAITAALTVATKKPKVAEVNENAAV